MDYANAVNLAEEVDTTAFNVIAKSSDFSGIHRARNNESTSRRESV